jgi:hypothetical protein
MRQRPATVTVLSWLYIVMGTVGFIYHARELGRNGLLHADVLLIEGLRVLAIVAGFFMLKGQNWARWLAIVWIALHVVASFYNSWQQAAMHPLFLAVIWFLLTRSAANVFFRGVESHC